MRSEDLGGSAEWIATEEVELVRMLRKSIGKIEFVGYVCNIKLSFQSPLLAEYDCTEEKSVQILVI